MTIRLCSVALKISLAMALLFVVLAQPSSTWLSATPHSPVQTYIYMESFATSDFRDNLATTGEWNTDFHLARKSPTGQVYSAQTLTSTLPTGGECASSVYAPETGKVYIFGGDTSYATPVNSIIEFNVDTEVSTVLTATLPGARSCMGMAYLPGQHRVLLFGGLSNVWNTSIYAFDVISQTTSLVGSLPDKIADPATVYVPEDNLVYLFGGTRNSDLVGDITVFDPTTNQSFTLLTSVPYDVSGAPGVYLPNRNSIMLYGGGNGYGTGWSWTTWETQFNSQLERVSTGQQRLPLSLNQPAWAYASSLNKIYILSPTSGDMVEVDTLTDQATLSSVQLPIRDYAYRAAATYVPSRNRIYIFGGSYSKGISRVNLAYASGSAVIQSKRISGPIQVLTATLDVSATIPVSQSVEYYLSNNGGQSWDLVTPGVPHSFATADADLRWKVVLSGNVSDSAIIEGLRVEYDGQPLSLPYSVFLPVIRKTNVVVPPVTGVGIYGQVTYHGVPIGGISLALRFYNGSSWSTFTTAVTNPNGEYSFTGAPSLGNNQAYYVRYGLNTTDSRFLYAWYNNTIYQYSAGQVRPGGDFDIADVPLLAPNSQNPLPLPVTFSWTPRVTQSLETYDLEVYYPGTFQKFFGSVKSGSFVLTSPAPNMSANQLYGWEVWVNNQWGTGLCYGYSLVKLASTLYQSDYSFMRDVYEKDRIWRSLEDLPR